MVRQKSRWILARVDFERDLTAADPAVDNVPRSGKKRKRGRDGDGVPGTGREPAASASSAGISRREIHKSVGDTMAAAFGAVGAGLACSVHVCLYDEKAQLLVIKVPRDGCGLVRASLTFLTRIESAPVVVSAVAVCGSARTARISGLHQLRQRFQQEKSSLVSQARLDGLSQSKIKKEIDKALVELEERMEKVRSID